MYDPTYLAASETAWDEGYLAGLAAAATDSVAENPHTKLRDDRRAYVLDAVRDLFIVLVDEDGEEYGDYVYDAILDAHADWIASRDAAKAGA